MHKRVLVDGVGKTFIIPKERKGHFRKCKVYEKGVIVGEFALPEWFLFEEGRQIYQKYGKTFETIGV